MYDDFAIRLRRRERVRQRANRYLRFATELRIAYSKLLLFDLFQSPNGDYL